MSDIHETVAQHHADIANIKEKLQEHAEALDELRETDMQILERMGQTATKEDIQGVRSHIDASINGILKDALNATPVKQTMILTLIIALTGIAALVIAFLPRGPH